MTSAREKRMANQFGQPWTVKTTLDPIAPTYKAKRMAKALISEFDRTGAIRYARDHRRDNPEFWDKVIDFIPEADV